MARKEFEEQFENAPITLHGNKSLAFMFGIKFESFIETYTKEIAQLPQFKDTRPELIAEEIINGIHQSMQFAVTQKNIAALFLLHTDEEEFKRQHQIGYKTK